jgi:hypothetical protein
MLDNVVERQEVLAQFPKLEKLHRESVDYDLGKVDYGEQHEPRIEGMQVTVNHPLFGQIEDFHTEDDPVQRWDMTDNAMSQLSGRLGIALHGKGTRRAMAPLRWFQSNAGHDNELVKMACSAYLNTLIDHHTGGWFMRFHGNDCRAILSDRYAVIDNTPLIRMVGAILDRQRGNGLEGIKFGRAWVSRDRIILDVILKTFDTQDPDSGYGVGFRLTNDEIGRGATYVSPMYLRNACFNSAVWEEEQHRFVHAGVRQDMEDRVTIAMMNALKSSREMVVQMLSARTVEIPNLFEVVEKLGEEQGWEPATIATAMIETNGQNTHYGLINGITGVARTIEDEEKRHEVEVLGGELLMTPSKHIRTDWARQADYTPDEE